MRKLPILLLAAVPFWAAAQSGGEAIEPPAWAYAVSKPPPPLAELPDAQVPQRVPGSNVEITKAQLRNLYQAPDWRPETHGPMPAIVANGRNPGVLACGFCHTPSGTGRPENANLTGLTVGYITQQLADFKSGARKSSVAAMAPQSMMARNGVNATDAEVQEAARYFAALPVRSFVSVVETDTVPRTQPRGWMLMPVAEGGTEPIGRRIIEVPKDIGSVELRDPLAAFTAYVPTGSLAEGRMLASDSARGPACVTCHGVDLNGLGDIPRLAARSPSYLVRQLIDFRSGARAGALSGPMVGVVQRLSINDMVALAAYAASLSP